MKALYELNGEKLKVYFDGDFDGNRCLGLDIQKIIILNRFENTVLEEGSRRFLKLSHDLENDFDFIQIVEQVRMDRFMELDLQKEFIELAFCEPGREATL
jgi:hypothetical protein